MVDEVEAVNARVKDAPAAGLSGVVEPFDL
jgi:hypothetical protein